MDDKGPFILQSQFAEDLATRGVNASGTTVLTCFSRLKSLLAIGKCDNFSMV